MTSAAGRRRRMACERQRLEVQYNWLAALLREFEFRLAQGGALYRKPLSVED